MLERPTSTVDPSRCAFGPATDQQSLSASLRCAQPRVVQAERIVNVFVKIHLSIVCCCFLLFVLRFCVAACTAHVYVNNIKRCILKNELQSFWIRCMHDPEKFGAELQRLFRSFGESRKTFCKTFFWHLNID
jgi:hypothetical protein